MRYTESYQHIVAPEPPEPPCWLYGVGIEECPCPDCQQTLELFESQTNLDSYLDWADREAA